MSSTAWVTLVQIGVGLLTAWVGWSVKTLKTCINKDIALARAENAATDKRVDRLVKELDDVKEDLEDKISSEEFIRASSALSIEVKDMGKTLARIEGKTDSTLMLASSVNRVAEAVSKIHERSNG